MSDHHPRYVVREQHGTTVGARAHTWDFLILDSWYCWREVVWAKAKSGGVRDTPVALRRRVYEYAARLNEPPLLCACGCGGEVRRRGFYEGGNQAIYVNAQCKRRVRYQREKASRGRVS